MRTAAPSSGTSGPLRSGRMALWTFLSSIILLSLSTGTLAGAPAFVANSQSNDATALSYQRKTFRDDSGYFWAFYFDGTSTYYTRSDDTTGASWTGTPQLFYAGRVRPSVWFDTDTLYVAFSSTNDILVQRGVISGGSISWSSVQTALDGDATTSYRRASVSRNTDGFIWVSARAQTPAGYYPCAIRSTAPNDISSWESIDVLSPVSPADSLYVLTVPLMNGDVYALWHRQGWIEGKRYVSGTGWEGSVTSIARGFQGNSQMLFSAVSDREGRVHLLYVSRFTPVCYRSYDGTSWSSEHVLSGPNASSPTLSINPSNQRLYALWIEGRRVTCKSAVLPSSSSDWRTESTNKGKARKAHLTSCYSSTSRINWLHTQGGNAPFSVMTDGIAVARISVLVSVFSFAFGTHPVNTWLAAQSALITNDGTWTEDIYAQLSQFTSGPFTWSISAASNGPDLCRAQWSTASDTGPWNDIASYGSEFLITTNLAVGNSVTLYFRIQTPTSTSSYNEYSADLTVRAED